MPQEGEDAYWAAFPAHIKTFGHPIWQSQDQGPGRGSHGHGQTAFSYRSAIPNDDGAAGALGGVEAGVKAQAVNAIAQQMIQAQA